uniref:Uncharacterized protein n=1 Tax=Halorubrum lacusprofundi TaxID=2247 RepID=A0A220SXA5_9EURY|nr:hypothetical protein [Halorubrum lacusprofundi]
MGAISRYAAHGSLAAQPPTLPLARRRRFSRRRRAFSPLHRLRDRQASIDTGDAVNRDRLVRTARPLAV